MIIETVVPMHERRNISRMLLRFLKTHFRFPIS